MHELLTLVSIAGVYVMVLVSPGPNFLVVTQSAISESRRHALYTGFGIACGSALLATLAATGMGLLLAQFAWLHRATQLLGGAYLIYVGVKIWRSAKQPLPEKLALEQRRSYGAAFRYGAMTNLTNPKAMVFFTTIFATLVGPGLPVWVKFASVAEIFALSSLWHFTLATAFSHGRIQAVYRNAKTGISRVTGGLLSGLGVQMLLTK
jgi:RhtB (resistance to homoserine/threonine) family protein